MTESEILNYTIKSWQTAAMSIGELLSSVGPKGYYELTPNEWFKFARKEIDHLKAQNHRMREALEKIAGGNVGGYHQEVWEYDYQKFAEDTLKEVKE